MGKLDDRIVLVTGGSRGIGRGICVEAAREGADVVVNYRRGEEAAAETAEAVEALGRRALTIQADVTDLAAVEAMVDRAIAEWGRLDVVVPNSGVASRPMPVSKMDPAEWHRVIDINLHGVFHTLRAAVPHLEKQGSGSVVIVSSIGADLCDPFGAPYYAAKAGVNALTKTLAKEVASKGIRVNAVAPGLIASEMGERMMKAIGEDEMLSKIPLHRPGTPAEVGKLVAYLASDEAAFITGQIYRIDGGAVM